MTILFITEFFPEEETLIFSGGVEAYNFYLVRELAKKNRVKVIYRSFSNSKGKHFLEDANPNLKIVKINTGSHIEANLSSIPERIMFFIKSIRVGLNENFDVVQGTNFVTYTSAFLVGFMKNKPRVAWYPDVFLGRWLKLFGIGLGVLGELSEKISILLPWSHIVALSESTKRKILAQGVKARDISVIYAGIDYSFFSKHKYPKEEIFTVCTISRLVKYKRVDLLIKATRILSNEGYNIRLRVVGDGPEKRTLKGLVDSLELNNRVEWLSGLNRVELTRKLSSSHLFCLCSEEEGFGMVVIEAAASGLPYIISSLDVLKEITRNGQGGLIFKLGDERDLADKIRQIIDDDPRKTKSLKKEGLKLARSYSWKNVADQFEVIYENCTKE